MQYKKEHKAPSHVYLVRHGVTEWNTLGKIQGHTDIDLSPEGEQQALNLAKKFGHITFAAIYASDLLRARHTAEIMSQSFGLSVETTPKLRERNWGEWEGRNIEEIRQAHGKILDEFIENPSIYEPVRMPGIAIVETYSQALARVVPCLVEIAERHSGQNVLVVSHGGILRGLMQSFGHMDLPRPAFKNGDYLLLESDGCSLNLVYRVDEHLKKEG